MKYELQSTSRRVKHLYTLGITPSMKPVFINKSMVFFLNLNFKTQDGGKPFQNFRFTQPEVRYLRAISGGSLSGSFEWCKSHQIGQMYSFSIWCHPKPTLLRT